MGINMCLCENNSKPLTNDLNIEDSIIRNYSYNDISNSSRALKSPENSPKKTISAIDIDQIIPEKKLHTKNDKELLYMGELYVDSSIFFCALTGESFSIYEQKSQFISMKKPQQLIQLENIISVDLSKDKNEMFFVMNYITAANSTLDSSGHQEGSLKVKAKNKESLFKWIVVLNFFVQKSKMKKKS